MKVRNGFVSNSSSSSFILVGVNMPSKSITPEVMKQALVNFEIDHDPTDEDGINDIFHECLYSDDFGIEHPSETSAYGYSLASFSDEYLEESEIPFDRLTDIKDNVKGKLEKMFNRPFEDAEIKLLTGTYCC